MGATRPCGIGGTRATLAPLGAETVAAFRVIAIVSDLAWPARQYRQRGADRNRTLAWPIAFVCTLDARLTALAAAALALRMLTLPLKGYAMVGIARFRASGDTGFSMLVEIIASAIAIPRTWFALDVLHSGLFAVPFAWITAWLFGCGATALRLQRFDWNTAARGLTTVEFSRRRRTHYGETSTTSTRLRLSNVRPNSNARFASLISSRSGRHVHGGRTKFR
jgi:hypothetical protein